uniref:TF-B3 domain-containing protein n=1 Tax=Kalanchoe fedtschenkoi TaxID=63787 RepID=A0A7N0T9Z1_KALFE
MGRPRPARLHNQNCESFFKVMVGDFLKKMLVPIAFVRRFHGTFPQEVLLDCPTGRSWWIGVVKDGPDRMYCQRGWKEFAQGNSLKVGDFLVFRYARNSKFDVEIYEKSGCLKEVSAIFEEPSDRPAMKTEDCSLDEITVVPAVHPFTPSPDNMSTQGRDTKDSQPRRRMQRPDPVAREQANKFNSNRPFFGVALSASGFNRGHVNVPASFCKKFPELHSKQLKLRTASSSKVWAVSCKSYLGRRKDRKGSAMQTRVHGAWARFARDNELRVGNVCVFELVDRNSHEVVFKVHIFR